MLGICNVQSISGIPSITISVKSITATLHLQINEILQINFEMAIEIE